MVSKLDELLIQCLTGSGKMSVVDLTNWLGVTQQFHPASIRKAVLRLERTGEIVPVDVVKCYDSRGKVNNLSAVYRLATPEEKAKFREESWDNACPDCSGEVCGG